MKDSGARPRERARRCRRPFVEAARVPIIVEELPRHRIGICRQRLRKDAIGDRHSAILVDIEVVSAGCRSSFCRVFPALHAKPRKDLGPVFQCEAVLETFAHHPRHIVHVEATTALTRLSTAAAFKTIPPKPQTPISPMRSRSTAGCVPRKSTRGHEILGVQIRRRDVSGLAATFARVRWIEGERGKAALGHRLRVETGGLLLDRAEWPADGKCRLASDFLDSSGDRDRRPV